MTGLKATASLSLLVLLAMCVCPSLGHRYQRCFNCRSRGELGDCKDPFYLTANSTSVAGNRNQVKALPCSSGWCKKFVVDPDHSGREGDKNYVVDRGCLGGGPDDGKGRCFEVNSYHGSPPGYLCICKGDLCNSAPPHPHTSAAVTLGMALLATAGAAFLALQ